MTHAWIKAALTAIAASAALYTPHATAGVHCTEKVTMAILHQNGDIYFQTDNTCSAHWCQINWGTPEKNKNGLAMLLSAKLSERPLTFYWGSLNACSEKNPVYKSPEYVMMY